MTKKHFIAIADELRFEKSRFTERFGSDAFNAMLDIVVSVCRAQNGRFDTDRFRGYVADECGPSGGKRKK